MSGRGELLTSSVELYEGGLSSSSERVSDDEEGVRSTDIEKTKGTEAIGTSCL
jgi:hypothetical protein